ncbi:MAG: TlpA disulfide reductase family protein [Aquihabitans sp.]
MSDPTDSETTSVGPPPPAPGRAAASHGRGILGISARTLAICVCIALIGAILAGLVASSLLGKDSVSSPKESALIPAGKVNRDRLLAVALETVEGKPTTLNDQLDGRPVVVNLWAQSCPPCVREMPLLQQASIDNPDVSFIGVDPYDELDVATAMAKQTGITYPWLRDLTGNFFFEAQAAAMPTTLLLDPAGNALASKTGDFKSTAELQRWIDENRN